MKLQRKQRNSLSLCFVISILLQVLNYYYVSLIKCNNVVKHYFAEIAKINICVYCTSLNVMHFTKKIISRQFLYIYKLLLYNYTRGNAFQLCKLLEIPNFFSSYKVLEFNNSYFDATTIFFALLNEIYREKKNCRNYYNQFCRFYTHKRVDKFQQFRRIIIVSFRITLPYLHVTYQTSISAVN